MYAYSLDLHIITNITNSLILCFELLSIMGEFCLTLWNICPHIFLRFIPLKVIFMHL